MNRTFALSAVALFTIGAGLLFSHVSLAGAPACTGYAVQHPDANCFVSSNCSMHNVCTETKRWEVSDNITVTGTRTVRIVGLRPNGGSLVCQACSTTKEGTLFACTASVPLTTVDIDTQFTIGNVSVPSLGGLFANCDMSPGAHYDSVSF